MQEFEEKNELSINKKIEIILVSVLVLTVLAIYGLSISFTGKIASVETKETVNSVSVSFTPEKPKVLEKMNVKIIAASNKKENFFLELIIVQGGKINKYRNYTFSLDAGDSNTFILDYIPTNIEKQNIVTNLYSSDKKVLYDSKTIEFQAESDVGPFDMEIVMLTNFVQRGENLPFVVKMKNFGVKGTDINLTETVNCFNKADIEQSSFLYMNTSDELEKSFILPTCNETGQHRIIASMTVYGTEFVSSKSQYFETDEISSLDFLVPDAITIAENSSYTLNIKYNNGNKGSFNNIKPIVFGIPSSWFTVSPLIIPEIKSDEFSVAILTFNVPKNSSGNYPIFIGASGNNLFSQKSVELKITSMAEYSKPAEKSNVMNIIIILFAVIIFSGVSVFLYKRKKKVNTDYSLDEYKKDLFKKFDK